MNKKLLWIGVIVLVVGGVILYTNNTQQSSENLADSMADTTKMMIENNASQDSMAKPVDNTMMTLIKDMIFTHSGVLSDVTGGSTSGLASFSFVDNNYSLLATFTNLPEPTNDDFYEGWIVQRKPFKFISTGKVEKDQYGVYTNTYSSGQDFTSYDFYVLTIEPNDGDPAPAGHIVEGVMTLQN